MPECFECTTLAKKALYKYSSFPFLSFPLHTKCLIVLFVFTVRSSDKLLDEQSILDVTRAVVGYRQVPVTGRADHLVTHVYA